MNTDDLRATPGDDVETLYAAIGELLVRTLPDMFPITREEAQQIVWKAFVSFFSSRPESPPFDWIVCAALTSRCEQRRPAGVPLAAPPDPPEQPEPAPLSRAFALLSPREREAVLLALAERLSAEEIAAELEVSTTYAKTLVQRATAKLRKFTEEST